jgi:hypothetical protein
LIYNAHYDVVNFTLPAVPEGRSWIGLIDTNDPNAEPPDVPFGHVYLASSTDRCNTFGELLSSGLIEQGFSRPLIEPSRDGTELGLAMQGQIGAPREILAEQSVGVFV